MISSLFPSCRQCLAASWGLNTERLPWRKNALITNSPLFFSLDFITEGDITLQEHPWAQLKSAVLAKSPPSPPGMWDPCSALAKALLCYPNQPRYQCRTLFCEERELQPSQTQHTLVCTWKKLPNQRAVLLGCSGSEYLQIFGTILLTANVSEEKHDYIFGPQLRGINSFPLNSAKDSTSCKNVN